MTGKACLAWLGDAARSYAKWMALVVLLLQVAGLVLAAILVLRLPRQDA